MVLNQELSAQTPESHKPLSYGQPLPLPTPPRRSRTTHTILLLVLSLLAAFFALGSSGCQLLSPPPPVADTIEQALKDGQTKEDAAQKAQNLNRKDDATHLYTEAITYYDAVSKKFTGANRISALRSEAHAQEKLVDLQTAAEDVHDYTPAMHTLRTARQQTDVDAALHADVEHEYADLIGRMDKENAKTKQYQFMNQLVTLLGGDEQRAPIFAILIIAVAVTLVTWPLRVKQARSAKELARFAPELKKLQDKYKGDPQELWQKQQAFNKKHGINQFAGCIPALLQWPVVFVMYRLILNYQFHFQHTTFAWINPAAADAASHLGLPFPLIGHNLGEQDVILLALYAVSMYVQTKLSPVTSSDPAVIEQQKMMATFMPVIFFVMMLQYQLPSAFVLYWVSSNVLFVAQQWWINRHLPTLPPLVIDSDDDDAGSGGGSAGTTGPLKPNPKLVSPSAKQRRK